MPVLFGLLLLYYRSPVFRLMYVRILSMRFRPSGVVFIWSAQATVRIIRVMIHPAQSSLLDATIQRGVMLFK